MKKINKILIELYQDRSQFLALSLLFWMGTALEEASPSDLNVSFAAVWVAGAIVVTGLVTAGVGMYQSGQAADTAEAGHALAEENMRMQNEIAMESLKDQREETAKLNVQKDKYRAIEFKNPYENMQSVYEDATVNQGEAQFEKEMFQQSQADIMQGLRGAAGSSGIAGLAQTMANQGQLAAKKASLSIGAQERVNQTAKLSEQKANDLAFRTGEASVEEREMNRQSTLLGMQMGQLSGANAAVMQSQQNQMAAGAAQANLYGQQAAGQQAAASQMISSGLNSVSSGVQYYGQNKPV